MLEVIESIPFVFDIAEKYGITYANAYLIADAINNGLTIASILSVLTGVGSIIGASTALIRKKIFDVGLKKAALW